ncbi:MAG: hypothetical protein HYX74_00665 [Acidobacteria bacterium]|nr:hypothetical protein [Acidobacteriota bacterium]
MRKHLLPVVSFFLWWWSVLPIQAAAQEPMAFFVKHDRFFTTSQGRLIIDGSGISYTPEKERKKVMSWKYVDIQQIKIESPARLELLTYEDTRWQLGRDRRFVFQIVQGQITPGVAMFLRERVATPVVSAVFAQPEGAILYSVPAKHLHALGMGCQGELLFAEGGIYYRSSNTKHSRFWLLETIESLGQQSPFTFRITVREQNLLGAERNFQFQLKRAMGDGIYQRLWRKVYEPESWLSRLPAGGRPTGPLEF